MVERCGVPGGKFSTDIISQRFCVVIVDKGGDGFLQPEGADNQHVAAKNANERQKCAPLVAEDVADNHLRVEGETRPQRRDTLQQDAHTGFRGLRAKQVRSCFTCGTVVCVQADEKAHQHGKRRNQPCDAGNRRMQLLWVAHVCRHNRPDDVRNRNPTCQHAKK